MFDEEYNWTEDPNYKDMKDYFYGEKDEEADWERGDEMVRSEGEEPDD